MPPPSASAWRAPRRKLETSRGYGAQAPAEPGMAGSTPETEPAPSPCSATSPCLRLPALLVWNLAFADLHGALLWVVPQHPAAAATAAAPACCWATCACLGLLRGEHLLHPGRAGAIDPARALFGALVVISAGAVVHAAPCSGALEVPARIRKLAGGSEEGRQPWVLPARVSLRKGMVSLRCACREA